MPDSIPCLTCGGRLRIRKDKNGKPYVVCDDCGLQTFIRRKKGIQNLAELINQLKMHDFHFREHTHVLCKIQAVLAELRGVQKEIKSLESESQFFMNVKDRKKKQRTLDLLQLRIKNLHFQLEDLAKRGSPRRA